VFDYLLEITRDRGINNDIFFMLKFADPFDDKELFALHARSSCGSGGCLLHINIDIRIYYFANS
jgi:hypothetical protein